MRVASRFVPAAWLAVALAFAGCPDDRQNPLPTADADITSDVPNDQLGDSTPDGDAGGPDTEVEDQDTDAIEPDGDADTLEPDGTDATDITDGGDSGDATDGGDTDTDTVEPPVDSCNTGLTPPASGLCDVTAGDGNLLIQGTLVLPDKLLEEGQILVVDGSIACVGCDCTAQAEAAAATWLTCPDAVVSPGLINAHDHITFSQLDPWTHPGVRYDHRHEWRKGLNGKPKISSPFNSSGLGDAYGEMRQVMAGTTSLFGSGGNSGFLRNLDVSSQIGFTHEAADYSTFPLGDSDGDLFTDGCGGYDPDDPIAAANEVAYVPHVAEGIIKAAENEFVCMSGDTSIPGAVDLLLPNAGYIHGIGLTTPEVALLAAEGTALVWSPRSNSDLYGMTAHAPMYERLGALIALGTDWTRSGSVNLLRELKCAEEWSDVYWDGYFSDADLIAMVTHQAAEVLGFSDALGSLTAGKVADITIWDATENAGYRAILDAGVADVALVLNGGVAQYGDDALVAAVTEPGDCEAMDVCGTSKRLCVQRELGMSLSAVQADVGAETYGLFFCGTPTDEPVCTPMRPTEYDGAPTASDADGDGIPDAQDTCPNVFNPLRPVDDMVQPNADGDALGDECDPCPFDADTTACTSIDPLDIDNDGIPIPTDNCPSAANPLQEDGDEDGIGDACDACPEFSNVGGVPCPVSIYDVKQGSVAYGTSVLLLDMVVTASGGNNFVAQLDPTAADYNGIGFSGIYVYNPDGGSPAVGEKIDLAGVVSDYFGQTQLVSPSWTVDDAAWGAPAPTVVDPADVAPGGTDEDAMEGILVTVQNVTVLDTNPAGQPGETVEGEFLVTGNLSVDDWYYLIDPPPAEGAQLPSLTGVLRFSWERNKLSPRDMNDVSLGPPALLSFGPATVYIYEGQTGATSPPLMVGLTNASPSPVAVSVTSADALVTVEGGANEVTVASGELTASVNLSVAADSVTADTGPIDLTASLDGTDLTAQVIVLDDATLPAPVAVDPASATVAVNGQIDYTVTLDLPAPPSGQTLTITPTGAAVTAPATVDVDPGAMTATFSVTAGATAGTASIAVDNGVDPGVSATLEISEAAQYGLLIVEVFYDANSTSDDQHEWVRLFNGTGGTVDLSGYSLGWGGTDYTYGTLQLAGTVEPGACFVVGGPQSDALSFNVVFDQALDFSPDIQNSGSTADGVALFDVPAASVTASTVPIDAVVYGGSNSSGLLGPDGSAKATPDVGDAPSESSIYRVDIDTWEIGTPNAQGCIAIQ